MALPLNLPRLDAFLPTAGYLPPRKPVVEEQPSAYDQLSPLERQEVDDAVAMQMRQQQLAEQPRGTLAEIGTGLVRGAVSEIPRLLGGMMKAPSQTGPLHDIGENIQRFGVRKGIELAPNLNEGAHNQLTRWTAEATGMAAPSLAALATLPVFTALGAPAAVAVAGAGAVAGGVFGTAKFQDTYEKAIKAGKTPEEARALGAETGLYEGFGEALGTAAFGGATKFVPRILGQKYTPEAALAVLGKPSLLKEYAKNYAKVAPVEVGTEMGQNYFAAAAEKREGVDDADPWQSATSAIGPTMILTGLVGGLQTPGMYAAQKSHKRATAILDDPNAPFQAKDAAIRNLAPVMEPLVGKEALREWRMQTIVDASDAEFTQRSQDQSQAMTQALDASQQIPQRQPTQEWDNFIKEIAGNARAVAEGNNAKDEEALFRKLATTNLPEGVPSFSQFVAARRRLEGEPANIAINASSRGLKLAYIQEINRAIRDRALTVEGENRLDAPAATPGQGLNLLRERSPQGQLALPEQKTPLGMPEADASARLQAAAAEEKPAQGTAKALGLLPTIVKVDEGGGIAYSAAKQERYKWLKGNVSGLPKNLLGQLVDAKAPQLAEAVQQIWHDKGGARGVGPKYNPQLEALYTSLTNGRDIRQPFGQQAQPTKEIGNENAITAKDFQDPLDPQGQVSTAVDEAQGNAQAQRKGQALLTTDSRVQLREGAEKSADIRQPLVAGHAGTIIEPVFNKPGMVWVQFDGMPESETHSMPLSELQGVPPEQEAPSSAAPVAGEAVLPPLAAEPVAGAAPTEKKTQATVLKARGLALSVTPGPITVTATGQAVPWGDFSRTTPEGTITYDTPVGKRNRLMSSATAKEALLAQHRNKAKSKNWGDVVPAHERRKVPVEIQRYGFEFYNYDSDKGRAEGTNTLWSTEYARAVKNATHQNAAGENARAALKWLKEYEGQDITERAVLREVNDIFKWNDLFKKMAEKHAKKISDAIDEELEAIVEERRQAIARGMSVPESDAQAREQLAKINRIISEQDAAARAMNYNRTRALRQQDKARNAEAVAAFKHKFFEDLQDVIKGVVENDPRIMDLQTALPNYQPSAILAESIKGGKLGDVLATLAKNGPSEWSRDLATQLQRLGLTTSIELVDVEAYNAVGERVYGRYDHKTNTVRIYRGGENAHTVLHEVVHAVTVGKINEAEAAIPVAPGQRSSAQQAAVVALKALQDLRKEIEGMARGKFRHAFKNDKEFVAEVQSNEEFQRWLSTQHRDGRSMLQRFRDWVRSLFGFKNIGADTMLKLAMNANAEFVGDSRFGEENGATFDQSLEGAMAQADRYGQWMVGKWNEFAAAHTTVGKIRPKMREAVLSALSTFQLGEMVDRSPAYVRMSQSMTLNEEAGKTKTVIQQGKHQEFSIVTTAIDYVLAKFTPTEQRAKEARLQELAGAQSILGIDLNKGFDENAKTNKELDPQYRDYVNRLHAEYMALDPRLRKAVEDSIRLYRKNYIQQTATLVTRILRAYGAKTTGMYTKFIEQLDILDKALLTEGFNTRPAYYHDAYSANLDIRLRTMFTEFNKATKGEDASAIREDMLDVEKFYNAAVSNPYQHLGRSGKHFISFAVAEGDMAWTAVQQTLSPHRKIVGTPGKRRHVFLRFENAAERDAAYKAIDALGAYIVREDSKTDVKAALRSGSIFNEADIAGVQGVPAFVQRLINHTDAAFPGDGNAEIRRFIKRQAMEAVADTSAQKALLQRKDGGVAGYDANFSRSFAQRVEGMSSMLANAYTLPMYDAAFGLMREEIATLQRGGDPQVADGATAIFSEMGQRFSNSLNPVDAPIIDRMRSLAHNFYLGLSPAFVLGNTLQPYHLALPYLGGRYGFVISAKEMGKATAKSLKLIKNAASKGIAEGRAAGGLRGGFMGAVDLDLAAVFAQSGLTDGTRTTGNPTGQLNEIDGVERLMASGQLDTTQTQEFARLTAGNSKGFSTAMRLLSTGSHYSEVNNRLTTFLAAYNLEMKGGRKNHNVAVETAIKAVQATQLDYSNRNTARAFGRHGVAGKVTPLLTQFQQYSFQTMELIWRMASESLHGDTAEDRAIARKQLGGVMATTSVIAGTLGLPLANVIARMADAILGDDDEPSDVKVAYRSWLAEVFGNDVGELIARGAPRALLGFDTSSRLGMGDILPGSRFMTDRRAIKDMLESGAFDMLGPAISAGQDMIAGVSKIYDGQVMDGLIQMTPLSIRGPIKAAKMANGGYTTATGNQLPMEVTPWATIVQSAGFTPSVKAEQSEVNFAFRQMDGLLKQRKTVLSNELYRLSERGEDTTAALKRVMAFNQTNPQYRIDIGAGMAARARARSVADTSGVDIATLPRYLPLLQRYNFANTE